MNNGIIFSPEYQKINAFKLWCWRIPLRIPWTTRRSKKSILKELKPEYSLEGVMLKLKLQYHGHLMGRAESLDKKPWGWERSKTRGGGDDRGWDGWMASPTQWTWVWANSRIYWRTGLKDSLTVTRELQLQTIKQHYYKLEARMN